MGIDPPSLGVVTFDGLDSVGRPYNVNDVLAKGFADNLTSQPLRMDLVDPSLRTTVFLSFYYQFRGNGEAPDAGDSLFLQFKNKDNVWETVWSVNNNGTLDKNNFVQVILPIAADRFYYDSFQFQFRNYARLSGPYDTWNLDYVYINKNRSSGDLGVPDRTIYAPLTSLFKKYYSIPVNHLTSSSDLFINPSFFATNLRINNNQPANYSSSVDIVTKKNGVSTKETISLDDKAGIGNGLVTHEKRKITIDKIPVIENLDLSADSIGITLRVRLFGNDNVVDNVAPVDTAFDYTPNYYPIDFRLNDTTSVQNILSNYYAYDDGSAEYGATLNGSGAQLAYRFDVLSAEPQTILGVYFYFPRFGVESSQIIQIQIFNDLSTSGSPLYQESMTIERSQQNQFTYHKFERFVVVQDSFYIGWKQSTSTSMVIGLDKNTDTSNQIYYNTNGTWEQPANLKGSLMMRPAFGGTGEIVGLPEEQHQLVHPVYPNPNNGIFFLPADAQTIRITDMTGKPVLFSMEENGEFTQAQIQNPVTGLYLVRFILNDQMITQKIIVKQ